MNYITGEVKYQKFSLNTCASTHMCQDAERFESLVPYFEIVISSSRKNMNFEGKGSIILNWLKNNEINKLILQNSFYVPKLNDSLFLWKQERKDGYTLFEKGHKFCIMKINKICLETSFNGQIPLIKDAQPFIFEKTYSTYHI